MGRGAMIYVPKDAHGNWKATHSVLQKTVGECYWLHLEPTCHINVGLIHSHNAR